MATREPWDERMHPGEWTADPAPRVRVDLGWLRPALVAVGIVVGVALVRFEPALGVFVGLALAGLAFAPWTKRKPLPPSDRFEGRLGADHQLVVVECIAGSSGHPTCLWTDTGGLVVESDHLVFSSPAMAFVLGGQDVDGCVSDFGLTRGNSTIRFGIAIAVTDDSDGESRDRFRRRLNEFFEHRTPYDGDRQCPPLRPYVDVSRGRQVPVSRQVAP